MSKLKFLKGGVQNSFLYYAKFKIGKKLINSPQPRGRHSSG